VFCPQEEIKEINSVLTRLRKDEKRLRRVQDGADFVQAEIEHQGDC
jgi:hypothetical protein